MESSNVEVPQSAGPSDQWVDAPDTPLISRSPAAAKDEWVDAPPSAPVASASDSPVLKDEWVDAPSAAALPAVTLPHQLGLTGKGSDPQTLIGFAGEADPAQASQSNIDAAKQAADFVAPFRKAIEPFMKNYVEPATKAVKVAVGDEFRAIQAATVPLQLAQRAIVGNALRFIDPTMMDRMRQDQAEDPWKTGVGKALDEVAPPIYIGSDYVLPKIRQAFKNLGATEGSALESLGAGLGFVASVAVDTLTDPLFYTELLAPAEIVKAAERAGAAEKIIDGVKAIEIASPGGRSVFVDVGKGTDKTYHFFDPALAAAATDARGLSATEKDLVQLKAPFVDKPILSIKGQAVQDWARAQAAAFESTQAGRWLQTFSNKTTDAAFNQVRHINDYETAMTQLFMKDIGADAEMVTQGRTLTKDISKYAVWTQENGPEAAAKIASFKGVKLSPEDVEMATDLGNRMAEWRGFGQKLNGQLTGEVIPTFAKNEEDIQRYLAKTPGALDALDKLPDEVKPFIYSENANLRRRIDPNYVQNMRDLGNELKGSEQAIDSAMAGRGLKQTADAAKERIPLASWAYEYLEEKKTGLKDFFDPDIIRTTQADVADLIRTASDSKFAKYVTESGLTRAEIETKIEAARRMVEAGTADITMQKLAAKDISKDFGQVKVDALKKLGFTGTTSEGASILSKQGMYYEKSVADYLNSRYAPMPPSMIGSFAGWFNTQIAKSYLTNIGRAMPRLYETIGAGMMAGLRPQYLAETIVSRLKSLSSKTVDPVREIWQASGLSHDLTKSYNVTKKMITNPKLYDEAGAFSGVTSAMQMYKNHGEVVTSEIEKSMTKTVAKLGGSALEGGKAVIEFANNNPLAHMTRDVVNGFENLPKEALFRQMLAQGKTVPEAIDYVGKTMLDFRFQPSSNLGAYVLFGNYHAQNMARLPFMIAKNPWVINLADSDSGAIKRAMNDTYGWNAGQVEGLQRVAGPIPMETAFGGILPGAGSVMRNPQHAQNFLNQLVTALTGKLPQDSMLSQALQKTPDGFQVLHNIPSTIGAAKLFLFGSEVSMTPPILRAMIDMAGMDIVTGRKLVDYDAKVDALSKTLNPYRSPNFWNVFNGAMNVAAKAQFSSLDDLFNNSTYRAAMRVVGGDLLGNAFDSAKPSRAMLNSLVQTSTLGLFRLSQPDMQFQMHVRSVTGELKELEAKVNTLAISNDPAVRAKAKDVITKQVLPVVEDLKKMVKFRDSYKRATDAIRANKDLSRQLLPPDNPSFFDAKEENEEVPTEERNPNNDDNN